MAIEIISGDLLDAFDRGDVNYIGHCVNCQGVMGSGIAKSIKERYPIVYNIYRQRVEKDPSNSGKHWMGRIQEIPLSTDKSVFNLFAQDNYGLDRRQVNYGALSSCLFRMENALFKQVGVVGFPYRIASDRAGGDWNIVLEMIEFYFKDHNVKIYKLT